ncbi:MAG: hypothetical protein FJ005_09095 [Chloroflexi bacterium]|nr:hypothetical protein [Chloroflexota bacterium]
MLPGKNKRSFELFCLVTTIIEELVLVAVLLWLLPQFGINIPIWLFIVLVLTWAGWSYLTYRLGKSAIGRPPAVGPEAMVGTICQTTTPLCPKGYVQSGTEIWQACSIFGDIDAGVEVVIIGIKGLTLFVTLSSDTGINKTQNQLSEGAGYHDGLSYNRL